MIITEAKIREISDTIAKNYAPDKIILFNQWIEKAYHDLGTAKII